MGNLDPGSNPDVYRFVVRPSTPDDPRSIGLTADAHALGLTAVEQIQCQDIYFIKGSLSGEEINLLAARLLSDPLTQNVEYTLLSGSKPAGEDLLSDQQQIEVTLRPGVTDPVAEQIIRAAHLLGAAGVCHASTGQRFIIHGNQVDQMMLDLLAGRLLANPVIQRYALGLIEPIFPQPAEASWQVEQIPVRELSQEGLLALSRERRAALDLEEMLAIQQYYQGEQRDMTDVELETIAQTWSEHCGHKTFKACLEIQNPGDGDSRDYEHETQIDGLLKTYLRAATDRINAGWVRSAFVDNAGIIDFDQDHEVSFKVETHNHPSAIEPFGGANTGVGGVIRDVIGVSAKPIAATDVLCFGPAQTRFDDLPAGVLHPRRIRSGVIAGVQDYGNKIGLPTVSGAILYDPGFTANPLVFCGCVGIAPKGRHVRTPQVGDYVIVLGGKTGRDGLRGATFSSMTMDAQTGEVAGASVQIGAPIVEKGLIDVIVLARDLALYTAITDCGAGGLSSAVGEMASVTGADVDLQHVQLKYSGLAPWEIWLSEAQERMVLAVPEACLPRLQELCTMFDVELTNIGIFTGSNRLVVRYGEAIVLDLANAFLHEGIPQRHLKAILPPSTFTEHKVVVDDIGGIKYGEILSSLLSHPNIASKAPVIRIYDHEVQGGTIIKPLTGIENDGPSDAVVLKPIGTTGKTAIVLGTGINPEYGKYSPYSMAVSVIDEAIRNAVSVGADPAQLALLDNFCWGDPKKPETMGSLIEASRGCYDAAVHYGTPFISGKDSLNNEYFGKDGQRHAIPPTLLISSIGVIPDLSHSITLDLKQPDSSLYLVGHFQPRLGGSHLALVSNRSSNGLVPGLPEHGPAVYRALHTAIQSGFVQACHDLSEGGLAVCAAEMSIAGRAGLDLEIDQLEALIQSQSTGDVRTLILFGETNGCLLVEVSRQDAQAFETLFNALPVCRLGKVTKRPELTVRHHSHILFTAPVSQLVTAWQMMD